jgi:hypothetical protein
MSSRVLEVRIMGGDFHGKTEFIPRITLSPTEGEANFLFQLKHRQFPVRLAFSITINKAQGQSMGRVGIDLRVPVFSHRQLYMALSCATSNRNVRILLPDDQGEAQTTNVVYPEVLTEVSDSSLNTCSVSNLHLRSGILVAQCCRYFTHMMLSFIDSSPVIICIQSLI